jgi:hypothetical protein
MEHVLQKNVEIRYACSLENLELPKIDMEEVVTFHNGEQNDLEGIIKSTKLKANRPTRKNPLEL